MRWLQIKMGMETLFISLISGFLFYLVHIPLPWMLGPVAGVMAWRFTTKRPLYWPIQLRQGALVILGYMLGSSFTRETAIETMRQLPYMLGSTMLIVVISMAMGYYVAKAAKVGGMSGFFGSVPGGLSQMVTLGEEVKGVDATVVTFMQTIRVISVVFLVPFLTLHGFVGKGIDSVSFTAGSQLATYLPVLAIVIAGAYIGQKLRFPVGYLTGPLLFSAIAAVSGLPSPQLPTIVIIISQVCIGAYIGLLMKPNPTHDFKRLGILTTVSSILLVFLSLIIGILLSMVNPISIATGFLSTAPGGMAEMGITATMVHADLSMVSAYQLFRVFFVMFAVPPLLKWWVKRGKHTTL